MPVSDTALFVPVALFGDVLDVVVLALVGALAINLLLDVLVLRRRRHRRELRARENQLEAAANLSAALARVGSKEDAARIVLDSLNELVGFDFSGVMLLSSDGSEADGLVARANGADVGWYPTARIDLEKTASGVRQAVESHDIFTVVDAAGSSEVSAELIEHAGLKSAVFLPLESEQGTVGVLVAGSTSEIRSFRPEQLALMRMFAAEGSLAFERLESLEALERALQRERRVKEISRRVRTELDLDRVAEVALRETANVLGVIRCFLRLFEPGGATPIRSSWLAEGVQPIPPEVVPRLTPANIALRELRTVVIDDVMSAPELNDDPDRARELLLDLGVRGVMTAPIVFYGVAIGVLAVQSAEPRHWSNDDVGFIEAITRELGVVLRAARALERERQVAEISRRVRAETDLDRLLSAALEETAKILDVTRCLVRLGALDETPELRAEWRREGLEPAPESAVPYLATSKLALSRQETIAITDIANDPRLDESPEGRRVLLELGSRASMSAPIIFSDEAIGALTVHASEPRPWPDDEIAFLGAIAREIGVALHTGRLIEENKRTLEEHRALLAATEAIAGELELDTMLAQKLAVGRSDLMGASGAQALRSEAVRQAMSLLEADAALIFDLERNEIVVREGAGEGLEEMYGRRFPAAISIAGDLVHSRKPIVVGDVPIDQGSVGVLDPVVARDFKALIGVPLLGPDDFLAGALIVYSRRPRIWRPKEVDALLTLAANTATALAGAALYLRVSLEREQSMAILSSVADGIVAVDRSDRVVLWNAAAERITGIASDEALGQLVSNVLRHEEESVEESGERSFLFKRGPREVWLRVSEATMQDPTGQIAGRIYTLRDISADRLVEQAKSDFVSLVSHELRAPLTSIYGFAETLLRRGDLFDELQRRTFLSYIAQESERLTVVVDSLLDVAELDAGDLQVELATTDVSSLVRQVVESARAEVERNGADGHHFVVDLPDESLGAEADRDKLRTVLSNLIDNAVKFSPGGGTVTVSGQRRPGAVELLVADEGVGIPEQERERIFRKFVRGSSSVLSGGTGLGLFITRGLVTAMGGRIWVDSTEGEGSTFGLELPLGSETEVPQVKLDPPREEEPGS